MAGFTNDPFLVAYVGIVLERELSEECRTMTLACQLNRRDKSRRLTMMLTGQVLVKNGSSCPTHKVFSSHNALMNQKGQARWATGHYFAY